MPGAIGWAPALLPSRGGVIDAQGSIRDRARCDWEIEEVGEVEEASLLPIVPTRLLRQARSLCEIQVLPPCQFFGHTGCGVSDERVGRARYRPGGLVLGIGGRGQYPGAADPQDLVRRFLCAAAQQFPV